MKRVFFLLSVVLLSSCATIFKGSKARITVANDQVHEPVSLMVDGKAYPNVYLPTRVKVKRGFKPSTIAARASGYEQAIVTVDKKFCSTTLLNILLGGVPGMAIDAATGAMMKPERDYYYIPFRRIEEPADETADAQPAVVQAVSRDNPGDTSLERTVLRWYFESQPQGARIFWRVISSVPDQVKNTNELWLGNTPFEETRSFNIQGLTYENSRDVQIEIKVRRAGYLDQNKRFNVRQAIDQQEISSFFDMIKAEE